MKKITFAFSILLFMISSAFGTPGNRNIYSKVRTHQHDGNQSKETYQVKNMIQYAKPICGTDGWGNTYPGATVPFGMMQWSPDSGPTGVTVRKGGYKYYDTTIWGFSLDHLSGAGCTYGGNFSFMPLLVPGESIPSSHTAFADAFSHKNETAKPGFYSVKLNNGIKAELTTTLRSGFGRFSYPEGNSAAMMINAASGVNGVSQSYIKINPADRSISGSATGGRFCRTAGEAPIYFYAVFNRPFKSYSTWSNSVLKKDVQKGEGISSGAFITFEVSKNRAVLVKVAISYVSVANAKLNLETENQVSAFSSKDFDKAVASAGSNWNLWLNKIQVSGGTKDELIKFYSMMYHTLLGPTVCSDVNGEYMGYDGKVHKVEKDRLQYANFSGWDIYRTECQFLAMIAPKEAGDMAQSLLIDYRQGGAFPRWGVPNEDSGIMMGDPAAPIIAGFYAFGVRNFDAKDALAGLVRAATDTTVFAPRSHTYERDALADYLKLGYVPEHQKGGYGNVSMTLEYASADFALSQFAKALGDESDYKLLLDHAQNWKNHFNSATGFLEMRRRDGTWAPGFAPDLTVYDGARAYVEGTGGQYVWMVPFNLKGLVEKMGGPAAAEKRLDNFFIKLNAGDKSEYANLGNEPGIGTPWIYCFIGKPYKTQALIRRIVNELFSSKPLAFPGNDDLGTMSAWYIFSALGIYPELPGSDVLVLGSPSFPKAVLHLQSGSVEIIGKGAGTNFPYVRSLKVNGKKWNKPWIRFTDISKGGTMVYNLSSKPDIKWGSNAADAPPSYDSVK